MTYNQAVSLYLQNCASSGKTKTTLDGYSRTLNMLGEFLSSRNITELSDVTTTILAVWKAERAAQVSAASMNLYLTHIRIFFDACEEMELIDKSPYKKLLNMASSALRREQKETYEHLLSEKDFRTILSNQHPKDAHKATYSRNRAILLILFTTGIRAMSAAALTLSDVEWDKHRIHIRVAKGGKTGYVPLTAVTENAIRKYLADNDPLAPDAPLFGFVDESGIRRPYSAKQMSNTAEAAIRSFTGKEGYYAHSLRHSFSSVLANRGIIGDDISTLLMHSKGTGASVTSKYITRDLAPLFQKVSAIFEKIALA